MDRRTINRFTAAALIAGLVVVLALAAAGGAAGSGAAKGKQVTIGAALPLTGGFAAYGATWKNAVVLAQNEINRTGGINGQRLKLPIEDWATDTAKAVQAFSKLATVNKANVILGGGSGAILAQAPLADRYQVPLINAAAQTPQMRGAAKYLFSAINDANVESEDLVRFMVKQLGIKRAIIYYVDNATGQGQRDGLLAATKKLGVEVMDVVSHSQTDTNYRTVLAKMKSQNPPAVLVGTHWENMGFTLKQAAEIGFKPTWLTLSPAWGDPTLEIAGKAASEGVYTIRSPFDLTQNQGRTKQFVESYKKRFGSAPDVYAAHFYDAIFLVKAAIERAGGKTDGASIAKALHTFNGSGAKNRFGGVSGPIVFDKDGMTRQPNFIMQIKNGELTLVKRK